MKKLFKSLIGLICSFGFLMLSPSALFAATLTFDPSAGVINKGCEISIKINLDTQGVQTDGTDVIVLFTPAHLSTTTSQITNGTIYPEYPGNSVDPSGKISISGISSVSSPFSGTGTFATIKLNVASTLKENDKINLNFDFDPNNKTKTIDTNVVERGTIADVLSAVTNGSYTVGTGSCASGITASPSPGTIVGQGQTLPGTTPATQSAQYQVYKPNLNDVTGGKAGLLDNTIILTAVGVVLVIAGIAGLAFL
ncbi:hypothetical protein HYW44_02340 [Candidatus Daviesbacteria bacterium]|nr:hypothetical protein [Candidatus Daviesbacteria bacterium]